jgi:DMSO/TMAO reductase YedYZ molybdopterin-dependent catalytic subunit
LAAPWQDDTTPMPAATVDRALAVLVVAMAATGLLSLRAGHPDQGWLFVVHGLIAGALALTVVLKIRRSLPRAVGGRRYSRLALGFVVSLFAIAALSGGYLWVATGDLVWIDAGVAGLGRWTILTLHAWAGLILVPLVILHVLPRRWRILRPSRVGIKRASGRALTRRSLVGAGAMALAGVALWATAAGVERVLGGQRRFTGSRWLPAGGIPIPTTFFGEPTPPIDPAEWRLTVEGAVERPMSHDLASLRILGDVESTAVLDCTSGWAIETAWRGVPLGAVLDAAGLSPGARRIEVRSVTGWGTSLEIADARRALLAWSVAGQPLPAANGAPLRLVVPDRRGLDWVKWIDTVRAE